MNIESGWSQFFNLLLYIGVLPISINQVGNVVSTNENKKNCVTVFVLIQLLIGIIFGYIYMNFWESMVYDNHSKTGDWCELYEELACGAVFLLTLWWMFANWDNSTATIKTIIELDSQTCRYKDCCGPNYVKRNFKLSVFCSTFYFIQSLSISLLNPIFNILLFLQMLQYAIGFIYSATVMSLYTTLVLKVNIILNRVNYRLQVVCQDVQEGHYGIPQTMEILDLLSLQNQVLFLCFDDLSHIFGLVNCFVSVYMLIDFSQIVFYLVTVTEVYKYLSFGQLLKELNASILWMIPKTVIYVLVFTCNHVMKEVSFLLVEVIYFKI